MARVTNQGSRQFVWVSHSQAIILPSVIVIFRNSRPLPKFYPSLSMCSSITRIIVSNFNFWSKLIKKTHTYDHLKNELSHKSVVFFKNFD